MLWAPQQSPRLDRRAHPEEWRTILLAEYQEVCRSHAGITDFRAKLLALLPLASGAGVGLLLAQSDGGVSTMEAGVLAAWGLSAPSSRPGSSSMSCARLTCATAAKPRRVDRDATRDPSGAVRGAADARDEFPLRTCRDGRSSSPPAPRAFSSAWITARIRATRVPNAMARQTPTERVTVGPVRTLPTRSANGRPSASSRDLRRSDYHRGRSLCRDFDVPG
jgi:hypothetical protein